MRSSWIAALALSLVWTAALADQQANQPGVADTKAKKQTTGKQTKVSAVDKKDQKKPVPKPQKKVAGKGPKAKQQPEQSGNDGSAQDGDTTPAEASVYIYDIACPAGKYGDFDWKFGKQCADRSFLGYNNAKQIAGNLNEVVAGLKLRNIDQSRILISWTGEKPSGALTRLLELIQLQAMTMPGELDENRVLRLYNNRNADKIAEALSGVYKGVTAKAVGSDLILLGRSSDADNGSTDQDKGSSDEVKQPFSDIDRLVARMDLPRPEVTLNAWSLQLSSKDSTKLEEDASVVRREIELYNEALTRALHEGWEKLRAPAEAVRINKQAELFKTYVEDIPLDCSKSGQNLADCQDHSHWLSDPICAEDRYCLGYHEAFNTKVPSLTRMLLILASLDSPDAVGEEVVNAMDGSAANDVHGTCPEETSTTNESVKREAQVQGGEPQLQFANFRNQLACLKSGSARLAALRAAYANFLFTYKWSVAYPNDFIPYELPMNASNLDGQLEPFMTALNRDVERYLDSIQKTVSDRLVKEHGYSKKELYSTGVVTVRAISGLEASVNTKTANYFDATPPLTVNDIAKGLKDIETNLPTAVTTNLAPNAAAALMSVLTAEKPAVARIGRSLNLKATPVSLITASAAELEVQLEASEDKDTQVYFKDKDQTKQEDDTSRVAEHTVTTHVRVESLKLFELSSFSASLRRKDRSFPLLPPFVDLPYIGSLVRVPLRSAPTYHRSFAVVSAIVVPTASDLAFGIPFVGDRRAVPEPTASQPAQKCLYEPVPRKKADRTHAGGSATGAGNSENNQEKPPVYDDKCAGGATERDGSSPVGTGSATQANTHLVVQRLHSARELDPAVRPYQRILANCLRSWTTNCDNLTLSTSPADIR